MAEDVGAMEVRGLPAVGHGVGPSARRAQDLATLDVVQYSCKKYPKSLQGYLFQDALIFI
jgi:hypothetical protein